MPITEGGYSIHFKKVFDDENDDRDLTDKLTNDPVEMSGLVNFALDGLNLLLNGENAEHENSGFDDIPIDQVIA